MNGDDMSRRGVDGVRRVLEDWIEGLRLVFESMADVKIETAWEAATEPLLGASGAGAEVLWWEQPFTFPADAAAWVGTPRSLWESAGALSLKAAGLETVEAEEARNTWLEMLGQSLSSMARSVGALLGREVGCQAGHEEAPGQHVRDFFSITLTLPESPVALLTLAVSPNLARVVNANPGPSAEAGERFGEQAAEEGQGGTYERLLGRSRTMDLLLDIELPVSISFGKIQLPMRDVLKLTTGSIVELDRNVNEPVEVLVNRCRVARGEVVVVEGIYAVRIQQITSRQDRLRSIR